MTEEDSYDAQRALFDRYHEGKEYVIDGVLHTPPNEECYAESLEYLDFLDDERRRSA